MVDRVEMADRVKMADRQTRDNVVHSLSVRLGSGRCL